MAKEIELDQIIHKLPWTGKSESLKLIKRLSNWRLFWAWWDLTMKFHSRNPQWLNNYFNKALKEEALLNGNKPT